MRPWLLHVLVMLNLSRQRRCWQTLSDAQLCERDIKKLDLTLDFRDDHHGITGVVLVRMAMPEASPASETAIWTVDAVQGLHSVLLL